MKVGTDGVLLGAWASGGTRILDVGTGTGVIAMMMAQRFGDASVDAVEIDADACAQAVENVAASPFSRQVRVVCQPVQQWALRPECHGAYDAIVSNPPFFVNALKAPAEARRLARHADTLPFEELFGAVGLMLSDDGEFSVIIPFDFRRQLEDAASGCGFHLSRECGVRTTPAKAPKRYLLAFKRVAVAEVDRSEGLLETSPNVRSPWYRALTSEFYL